MLTWAPSGADATGGSCQPGDADGLDAGGGGRAVVARGTGGVEIG